MGRSVTWLLVGAVAAIAVAAAVEALVDDPEAGPVPAATGERPATSTPPAVPISGREDVRELLESAGAGGVLYLTDRDCRLRTVVLPAVAWHRGPDRVAPCRFAVAPGGRVHRGSLAIHGDRSAVCRDGAVDVLTREGAVASRVLHACAPAWRPDGALTYVRDGELWLRPGEGPDHVVISGRDLASAVGPRAELEEVAWVDDRRLWAVVRHRREAVLVRFHDRIGSVVFRARAVEGLRVDRDGALAARTAGNGVTFFDPAGRRLLSVSGEAVSWAPAGHVAAVAGRREIAFVAPGARRVERLALVATDLEWLPSR